MEDLFFTLAARHGGYLFRHELIDSGFRDADIRTAMRTGSLTRLRHGTYAPTSELAPLTAEARHVLTAYSVVDKLGPGVALSHHSAALAHSPQSYGIDLATIHVTRLDGRHGRQEAAVAFHVGGLQDRDVCEVDGRLVVAPARAAFESACLATTESGMVTMSAIMHDAGCTRDELEEMGARMARWPRGRHARLAIRLADGRCESVGESRSLYMFWREGLPRPDTQVVVRTENGGDVARTDFGWLSHRHTGEFDGMVKYGRLNPYVDQPGQAITDEKRREDLVRGELVGMSRWTWSDLAPSRRSRTARMILEDLERSKRIYARNAAYFPLVPASSPHRANLRSAR